LLLSGLILLLSAQLYRVRATKSGLEAEIARTTQSLGLGSTLPEIPYAKTGTAAPDSGRVCVDHARMLILFSGNRCEACRALEGLLRPLEVSSGYSILILGTDGAPHLGEHLQKARHGVIEPALVTTKLDVREVPAVIVTDTACRVTDGAIGPTGSTALLNRLGQEVTRRHAQL